jgi:S1-C subfamily serine protease
MTSTRTRPTVLEFFGAIALTFAAVTAGLAAGDEVSPLTPPKSGLPSLAPILKKITPAAVHIETRGRIAPGSKSRRRDLRDVYSVGSGVVYDAQGGLIVTNDHVLEHANEITVTFTDGRMLKAKRVGGDPDFDLGSVRDLRHSQRPAPLESRNSRISSRPTRRSIQGTPVARSSACKVTSSASIPPSSVRPVPIPAWASQSRSTWRARSRIRS